MLSDLENALKKITAIFKQLIRPTFILVTGCYLYISYFLSFTTAYAEPLQIVILPFEINSEQNLDFLKNGIQDMLASRLSFKDEVKVIEKESVNRTLLNVKGFNGESLALLVGGQLKADFVIHGSVTVIGNSTSIDSKLIDISGKNSPIPFFKQTSDPGGVIPAINEFATTINDTLFKRSSNTPTIAPQHPIQTNVTGSSSISDTPNISLSSSIANQQLNSNFVIRNQQVSAADSGIINPEFTVTNAVRGGSGVWKSPTLKHLINGIAIGDTNKDSIMETVFISDHALYIYRFASNRFAKIAEIAKNIRSTYIGVDVGDINGNGVEEIFVTSLNPNKNMPNSFVLEYDGGKYVSIVENFSWYLKVVEVKGEGKTLLGQRQKSNKDNIYDSPIYKMRWDGDKYVPSEKILESGKINVLGSLFDDVTAEGTPMVVGYDKSEHLALFSNSGNILWRDVNRSGGSMNYFHLPKETPTDDQPIKYFPLSILSFDVNGDGNIEILYALNSDITGGYLSKFKRYNKGVIHCSFWNGTGFSLQWSTPEQTGRISDFIIADFDNDGAKELVISNVIKDTISSFSNSESSIIVYKLMQ